MNLTLSKDGDDRKITTLRTLMSDGTEIPTAAEAVRSSVEKSIKDAGLCPQCGAKWEKRHNRCSAQCDREER